MQRVHTRTYVPDGHMLLSNEAACKQWSAMYCIFACSLTLQNVQGQHIQGPPAPCGSLDQTGTRAVSACPSCQGTGFKPCGQCEGTGKNLEDKFGGRVVQGAVCWLCEGAAKTMCGECVDLTDAF